MEEDFIKTQAAILASKLGVKLSKGTGIGLYRIVATLGGLKVVIEVGATEGEVIIEKFKSPWSFQLSTVHPNRMMGLVCNISEKIGATFVIYSNTDGLYDDAISQLLHDWSLSGRTLVSDFRQNISLMLCSSQAHFEFEISDFPKIEELVRGLVGVLSSPPFAATGKKIATRYGDQAFVKICENNLPANLRSMLGLASKWAIVDENEVVSFAAEVGKKEVSDFLSAFEAQLPAIEEFCDECKKTPMPDEVVTFQLALQSFGILHSNRM